MRANCGGWRARNCPRREEGGGDWEPRNAIQKNDLTITTLSRKPRAARVDLPRLRASFFRGHALRSSAAARCALPRPRASLFSALACRSSQPARFALPRPCASLFRGRALRSSSPARVALPSRASSRLAAPPAARRRRRAAARRRACVRLGRRRLVLRAAATGQGERQLRRRGARRLPPARRGRPEPLVSVTSLSSRRRRAPRAARERDRALVKEDGPCSFHDAACENSGEVRICIGECDDGERDEGGREGLHLPPPGWADERPAPKRRVVVGVDRANRGSRERSTPRSHGSARSLRRAERALRAR